MVELFNKWSIDVTCPARTYVHDKQRLPKKKRERERSISNKHLSIGEVREEEMESSEDVEVLSRAIEKLLDEKRKREAAGDAFIEDDDDQLLLSTLISQLQSPKPFQKTVGTTKEEEEESLDSSPSKGKREGQRHLEESIEDIAKDIKEVKRQNKVTHILLSALIILTLTWQLSEYSMILMLKERLSHPIRSIGGMFSGMFKGKIRPIKSKLPGSSTSKEVKNNTNTGVRIQVPELLREFGFDVDDE